MQSFKYFIKENTTFNKDLIEFWNSHQNYLKNYFIRGGCGIAARDLSEFLYDSKKMNNEIIKTGYIDTNGFKQNGWFLSDLPEYTPEALTDSDRKMMIDSGFNPKNKKSIKQWVQDNGLQDEFRLIPHSWVELKTEILDPSGFYIDGKSGQFDKTSIRDNSKYIIFKNNIVV
jgi:hypothetical protein